MLTVIIDARGSDAGLPGLLAQLTAGAVDGVVREVLIVAPDEDETIDDLCEEMGADAYTTIPAAAEAARSELLMIVPAALRLRDGWIGALNAHLAAGAKPAKVAGLGGGFLSRGPEGVLVGRRSVSGLQDGVDIEGLARHLRLGGQRIG